MPLIAPRMLTQSSLIPRDDISPDALLDHIERAIHRLEHLSELEGVPLDWEAFRVEIHFPGEQQRGERLASQYAAITAQILTLEDDS